MNKNKSIRILYIEDNEGLVELFKEAMQDAGYHVEYALNGVQGLGKYHKGKHDVVVLDYDLPGKDGMDVLKIMAPHGETDDSPVVIMLTGQGNESLAVDSLHAGAASYMVKDVGQGYLKILPSVINKALERKELILHKKTAESQINKYIEELENIYQEMFQVMANVEHARKEAEEANKAKTDFLQNMSHEIRTPMNGIIGMTELLMHSELNEDQKRFVETIVASGELLLAIINDILDVSKIEAGELKLEEVPMSLPILVTEVVQMLDSRALENNVELAVKLSKGLPSDIKADPTRLRQILVNLIGNAIKFAPGGEVLVEGECVKRQKGKALLKFRVKDNGIGIPKDKQEVIFDKFSQADLSTTRKFGGTGLGLTICKKLVAMMQGEIGVESTKGKGATFWFTIEVPLDGKKKHAIAKLPKSLEKKRVLVVDDHKVNVEIIKEMLTKTTIDCEGVTSGKAALAAMNKAKKQGKPFDFVLIDFAMPIMDGSQLAQTIRKKSEFASTKLILVTALGKVDNFDFVESVGFDGYLLKPIYYNDLINKMQEVVCKS